MRKKTVTHSVKTIFWWIIYCLPLICYVVVVWGFARNGHMYDTFGTFIAEAGFASDSLISNSLYEIFGTNGVLPLFTDYGIFYFMEWFIGAYLLHLAVDFILFIPRLCHKFMNKFTRSDDCE